jgi:hypothetical protein
LMAYKVKKQFQAFALKCNLYRYTTESATAASKASRTASEMKMAALEAQLADASAATAAEGSHRAAAAAAAAAEVSERAAAAEARVAALEAQLAGAKAATVGRCKLNPVVTHSLKAPGFNPGAYKVKNLVSKFSFQTFNLYRCTARAATRR